MVYNKFSKYLKQKYGEKVYKIPVSIPVTCPNRDGTKGWGGCIFCGEEGTNVEGLKKHEDIKVQIKQNIEYIEKKYKANKYIIYFQNYSNTYLPWKQFDKYIKESLVPNAVAVYVSTRPDCITIDHINVLKEVKELGFDVIVELGLQTVNEETLKILNRGHDVPDFINACNMLHENGIEVCAHYIVGMPWDSMEDTINGAKLLSALRVEQVKCHSLYILKDTKLGQMYIDGEVTPITKEEYIERLITFLEYLDEKTIIQRILGRAPKERTLFCNWNTSWRKISDMIEREMKEKDRYQGKLADK